MSWTNALKITACAGAMAAASAALAGTIVIRSSGPSAKAFPIGKSLPEGQRVTLKSGDTLVLLGFAGNADAFGCRQFRHRRGSARRGNPDGVRRADRQFGHAAGSNGSGAAPRRRDTTCFQPLVHRRVQKWHGFA